MVRISEQEKKRIKEEAEALLSKFNKKLDIIKGEPEESLGISESRKEKEGEIVNLDFREKIFKNAPLKEKDLIFAEKGNWKR